MPDKTAQRPSGSRASVLVVEDESLTAMDKIVIIAIARRLMAIANGILKSRQKWLA